MAERSRAHAAFGNAIREWRVQRHISQEELGHRSGLHRTYVGGVERGERNLTYSNILKLADALGVQPSELLSRAEDLLE